MSRLFHLFRLSHTARYSFSTMGDSLMLTPRALSRLSELRAKAKSEGRADSESLRLRVKVDGGGCSGYKYEFNIIGNETEEGDRCFGKDGCFAVVDSVSLGLLSGATVDWEESLMRSAFIISHNPNAEASCGCKSSFSVKSPT